MKKRIVASILALAALAGAPGMLKLAPTNHRLFADAQPGLRTGRLCSVPDNYPAPLEQCPHPSSSAEVSRAVLGDFVKQFGTCSLSFDTEPIHEESELNIEPAGTGLLLNSDTNQVVNECIHDQNKASLNDDEDFSMGSDHTISKHDCNQTEDAGEDPYIEPRVSNAPSPASASKNTKESPCSAVESASEDGFRLFEKQRSIRDDFPGGPVAELEFVQHVPEDAIILGAFELNYELPMFKIRDQLAIQYDRETMFGVEFNLITLDKNLDLVSDELLWDQIIVPADVNNTCPFICIVNDDLLNFADSRTMEVLYKFVCDTKHVVKRSGNRVLFCNRQAKEIHLIEVDLESKTHRSLWTKPVPPEQEVLQFFMHRDTLVQLTRQGDANVHHLTARNVQTGEILWQTSLGNVEIRMMSVSDSILTVVGRATDNVMRVEHYDLETGVKYEKDPQRASELLGAVNHLIMSRDQFMIWLMRTSPDSPLLLMVIDFELQTVSTNMVTDKQFIGVAFRQSPDGPIVVKEISQPHTIELPLA